MLQQHNEHIWHMKIIIHMHIYKNEPTDPGMSHEGLSNLFLFVYLFVCLFVSSLGTLLTE